MQCTGDDTREDVIMREVRITEWVENVEMSHSLCL